MSTIPRKRVGLALGGGAARGIAHIGVLSALERGGIPVDCVAGTSAGSLIGALYSAGMSAERLDETSRRFGWRHLIRPTWPRYGLLTLAPLERLLLEVLGDLRFSDLARPYTAVATDLRTLKVLFLQEGRLAPAVHASCAVPGIIAPVELDGHLLGDGAIADNLPVDAVRAMGADYVIGVNILGSKPHWTSGPFGMGLAAIEHLIRRAGGGVEKADCLITPAIEHLGYVSLRHRDELIALGRQAAEEKLPEIRAALLASHDVA